MKVFTIKISILIDESFNINDCEKGLVINLMVDEWWLFLNEDTIKLIGVFDDIFNVKDFLISLLN